MISKWFKLKPKVILLRKQGKSITYIEKNLGIPRSTLSGWLKDIILSKKQYQSLRKRSNQALVVARKKAILWHNNQKVERFRFAEIEAEKTLIKIRNDSEVIELALAMLYLGEGFKKSVTTGMGNSDPLILNFFLKIITSIYKIDLEKIRFELHLRADQDPELMKKYWANELNAPLHRFRQVSIDKRTMGNPTYPNYKGVCLINCGNVAIQRKLVYIGKKFCERTINILRD